MKSSFKGTMKIEVEHNSLFNQISRMTVKLMSNKRYPRAGASLVLTHERSFAVLLHTPFQHALFCDAVHDCGFGAWENQVSRAVVFICCNSKFILAFGDGRFDT